MFGMGFFEIFMIAVVAIIFLGPEKLPKAFVDVAKFLRAIKKTMEDAKDSLDKEINLDKIKEEALAYKNHITQETQNLTQALDLKTLDFDANTPDSNTSSRASFTESSTTPTAAQKSLLESPQQDTIPKQESKAQREISLKAKDCTPLNFGDNLKTHKDS